MELCVSLTIANHSEEDQKSYLKDRRYPLRRLPNLPVPSGYPYTAFRFKSSRISRQLYLTDIFGKKLFIPSYNFIQHSACYCAPYIHLYLRWFAIGSYVDGEHEGVAHCRLGGRGQLHKL
jgi:hypothetical protein